MIVAAPPPVQVQADAAIGKTAVGVWGDAASLERLRETMESRGWTWATALLGDITPALFLWAPKGSSPDAMRKLIDDVNAGRYGKLTAGYALIAPPEEESERPDDA